MESYGSRYDLKCARPPDLSELRLALEEGSIGRKRFDFCDNNIIFAHPTNIWQPHINIAIVSWLIIAYAKLVAASFAQICGYPPVICFKHII